MQTVKMQALDPERQTDNNERYKEQAAQTVKMQALDPEHQEVAHHRDK